MRFRPLPSLALLVSLALAATAAAQSTDTTTSNSGAIKYEILTIGGEEVGLGEQSVGIDDCDNNAVIEVRLDGVPSDKESIDIYVGESCNGAERNSETSKTCTYVGNQPADRTTNLVIELRAGDLIDNCNADEESTPKIWLLAVTDPGGSEVVDTASYAKITNLHLDTRAPSQPTEIKGGSGERQIPVEWNTDDSDLERFIILIDPAPTMDPGAGTAGSTGTTEDDGGAATGSGSGGGWNGECGSSVLTPGADLSSISTRVKRKEINEATATHVDLSSADIAGTAAAVAVVAVDKAGNESPVSELGCVYVVPTQGFWEAYQQDPNAVDAGCPCRALGPAHAQSGLPVMLAIGWLARSARRRRSS